MWGTARPRRADAVVKGAGTMTSTRTQRWGPRAELAADAGLLTAAAVGILLVPGAIRSGTADVNGLPVPPWQVGAAALILIPLLAWWLHGRHVDGTATLGAIAGFAVGGVAVFGGLSVVALAQAVFGASDAVVGTQDLGVPVVMVVGVAVLAAAYLIVGAWLDIDALRDLLARRRTHVRLDVLRLLATAAYVAVFVGVIGWAMGSPSPEVDRVPIIVFLLGPGVMGAAAALGADLLVRNHEKHSQTHLISGA